jgi:3-deoxy-D-manno-octulosonic-acid transferase
MAAAMGFSPKIRRSFRGRKGLLARVEKERAKWKERPFWFHFASSGEFEQALPILEALKQKHPQTPLFLTYFSPSGQRAVELEKQRRQSAGLDIPWTAADYSPFDFPSTTRSFLAVLHPRALVVLNREFWPELFEVCFRRKIPVYVFASYLSKKARRALWFYKPWLERLTFLGTVDRSSAEFLRRELDTQSIGEIGDPRIERVLARRQIPSSLPIVKEAGSKIFVAASVWPQDFKALLPSLKYFLSQPGWRVFLVPHEPEQSFQKEIEESLKNEGIYSIRWSRRKPGVPLPGVVLVDSVGWLAELYRQADLAFVGGSFRRRVHNVLEPAAYGIPILTGPYIQNSFEAGQMGHLAMGLFSVKDASELTNRGCRFGR